MLSDIFDLNKFNVFSDEENYYFFRALEEVDLEGIKDKTIVDEKGNITRLMTDREFYGETSKYTKDSKISLGEIVNHIKMHYNKHTNCISFTTNANVAMIYGRNNYNDNYVMIKVPKEKMGVNVFNAGLYILDEINKKINEIVNTTELDDMQKYLLDFIDNAHTPEKLNEIKKLLPKEYVPNSDLFENGLEFNTTSTLELNALDTNQNFEKDKIILKMDVLKKRILPDMSNRFLIQTIGNAFSSLEIIHYNEVTDKELVNINSTQMDILGILQQIPSDIPYIDEIKQVILSKISDISTTSFKHANLELSEENLSLEKMYELTSGKLDYKTANYLYKSLYYLAKSKLRNKNSIESIRKVLNNDPKYNEFFEYIENNTYGIEPEICTRLTKNLVPISESVSLDINANNAGILDIINDLDNDKLIDILNNPFEEIKKIIPMVSIDTHATDKEEWMANGIIDTFDWKSYGVKENLSTYQRNDIVKSLIENDFLSVYDELKESTTNKDISKKLFLTLIKEKNDKKKNDTFTLEELENLIGYNTVKGSELSLYSYQRNALENIDRLFEDKDFAAAILPTGAGKSFVALAEIYERVQNNPNEKILYLSPNVEIIDQFRKIVKKIYKPEEHLGDSIDKVVSRVFKNIQFATYQDLKDLNSKQIKEKFGIDYDFVIFDELHRTGASEWQDSIEELLNNQTKKIKILGITATPQRDVDMKDMSDCWASKYGYTDEEILCGDHLAINMDIIEAIEDGIIGCPRVVNCVYSLIEDGTLDDLSNDINTIEDVDAKNEAIKQYEKLRRNVESASGVEKVLCDNLKPDGKYIFFLPVTKKNGEYVDEDGNRVSKSKATHIIRDYQTLVKQYMFGYEYLTANPKVKEISNKIINNEKLSDLDKEYLTQEKEKILLLSKIEIFGKPNSLNSDINTIGDTIISYMNWEKLSKTEQAHKITLETNDSIDVYSMSSDYSKKKNNDYITEFNKPVNKKMKLMFVMDKLNEGVHPEGIKGIVWLRPFDTKSKILYLQQLGRTIHALAPGVEISEEYRPLVLDLVNNSLKVRLNKETLEEIYLRKLNNIINTMKSNNINDINILSKKEYSNLQSIYELYYQYSQNSNALDVLDDVKKRIRVKRIIELGSEIDLWEHEFELKPVRRRENGDPTTDLVSLFGITGIERNFVELYDEIQAKIDKGGLTFEEKLHEIYINYQNKDLPIQKSLDEFSDKTKVGGWLNHNKNQLEELAQSGNEEAIWLVQKLKDKNGLTFEEKLHEVYKNYQNKDLPINRSSDEFSDKTKVGTWLSLNKKQFEELAQSGNEEAIWLVQKLKDKNGLTFEEKLHEIYINYQNKDLPTQKSLDEFSDKVKVGTWLSLNKKQFEELAQSGNEEAIWLVQKLKDKKGLTFEEKLHEIYINYQNKDLPTQKSLDEFSDKVKVGMWLPHSKNQLEELEQSGNEEAIWLVQKLKNKKGLTFEEKLHEIYINYQNKDLPTQKSLDEFSDNVKVGMWLPHNRNQFEELAQSGNEEAIWLVQKLKDKKGLTFEEKLHEVYINYQNKDLPIYRSSDKFSDKVKVGTWLSLNKKQFEELAQSGNEEAIWLVQKLKDKKELTFEEKNISPPSQEEQEKMVDEMIKQMEQQHSTLGNIKGGKAV